MAQQIIDPGGTRSYVPRGGTNAASIHRSHANRGLAVTSRTVDVDVRWPVQIPIEVELTNAANDTIRGVLLEYDNEDSVVIGRKGVFRFAVANGVSLADTHRGQGILATTTAGTVTPNATGIGEIVDYSNVTDNKWVDVDINIPSNP